VEEVVEGKIGETGGSTIGTEDGTVATFVVGVAFAVVGRTTALVVFAVATGRVVVFFVATTASLVVCAAAARGRYCKTAISSLRN